MSATPAERSVPTGNHSLEQVGGPELSPSLLPLEGRQLLGRSPECDWVLGDASVSRRHALIDQRAGRLFLRDLGSRAGTFLNDHRLEPEQPAPLRDHDRVRIGPYRFRLRATGSGPSSQRLSRIDRQASFSTQLATPILAAEQRLELIVEFAAAAAVAPDLDHLQRSALDFAQRGLGAQAVALLSAEPPFPLLLTHPANTEFEAPAAELLELAARGGVVPVRDRQDRPGLLAALRVDDETEVFVLSRFDAFQDKLKTEAPEFLHALARLAGLSVGNLGRRAIEARIERLQADLESAREVQRRVLPPQSGTSNGIAYALHLHPGRLVAGDLVDVLPLSAGRTAVVLGDVAGAGVGAGFLMAGVQAFLRAMLTETGDAARAAAACNRYVAQVGGGRFVTCWIGVFDPASRRVEVIDAGHGHVRRVHHDGAVDRPQLTGAIPLGVDVAAAFTSEWLALDEHSRLVLFSDGVTEQRSPDGTCFGALMLDAILERSLSPVQDIRALLAGLELHAGGQPPADDATLLSVAWAAPATRELGIPA